MKRGFKGQVPPGFGQILKEIRANSEEIQAKQKEKNPSKNIKIRMHTMLHMLAYTHTLNIEQKIPLSERT